MGFVLDQVRRDDLSARFAEALGAVVEREVAERAQQERGRVVVVVGGGRLTLLAEGVEKNRHRKNSVLMRGLY